MAATAEALYHKDTGEYDILSAAAAMNAGEVRQLPDGRAAVVAGLKDRAAGDPVTLYTRGVFRFAKTASIVVLDGGKVYWVRSTGKAHPLEASGDFYLGVCVKDAAAADTEVYVDINKEPVYAVELGKGSWTNEATLGLGVSAVAVGGSVVKLAFDAVAEVAQAALLSDGSVAVADGPILEGKVAIFDIGDAAALDISIGLANASHASDADSITESFFLHFDGNSLNILAESDDGTTEVAATDTTVDAVDDTYFEVWMDCRDLTDCKLYLDGVRVLSGSTFKLNAATGPLKALMHIEKTSDDTTADVRAEWLRIRSTDEL